eukprot:364480-Chlamydomonas_euryale.AAC.24
MLVRRQLHPHLLTCSFLPCSLHAMLTWRQLALSVDPTGTSPMVELLSNAAGPLGGMSARLQGGGGGGGGPQQRDASSGGGAAGDAGAVGDGAQRFGAAPQIPVANLSSGRLPGLRRLRVLGCRRSLKRPHTPGQPHGFGVAACSEVASCFGARSRRQHALERVLAFGCDHAVRGAHAWGEGVHAPAGCACSDGEGVSMLEGAEQARLPDAGLFAGKRRAGSQYACMLANVRGGWHGWECRVPNATL